MDPGSDFEGSHGGATDAPEDISAVGHLLLVEDDDDDAFLASEAIRRSEAFREVRRVRDGWEALSALADPSRVPSLVLLDLNMPVMDGFEVLSALEAEHEGSTGTVPPVVLLTSSDDPEERARAERFDIVAGYVVKPLSRQMAKGLVALARTPGA
ncbi:MAG: response regulator [Myxococcota bacterium]